jgi:hypothetical protein
VILAQGRQQLAHGLIEGFHGAADVHAQQQSHVVATPRAKHQLDFAGVAGRLVEVELGGFARALQLPKKPQRHLEAPHVEDAVGGVIAESPLFGDLHRRPASRGSADADSARVLATVTER